MRLTIFQSNKGDCLLLEAQSGELMLCDGGMGTSMRNAVRKELSTLGEQGRSLELVYISHIDNDHIEGVLQLLEDEAMWRVFDLHKKGNPIPEPGVPRPPKIKGILHNGFRDQIGANQASTKNRVAAQAIENALVALAPSLFATAVPDLVRAAEEMQAISTGVPEGIQVSQLIDRKVLNIPLNQPPGTKKPSKLLYAGRPGESFKLGSMKFTLIGPTKAELTKLREGWKHWLANHDARLKELREEFQRRVDDFSTGILKSSPFDLRDWEGIPDYKGVTVPNIASIMWMVEEGEGANRKRLLLTGDGQQDFILAGLTRTGFLGKGDNDGLHLDVLKVQHHGSEHNLDENFVRKVSADHYVFCGDGENTNPEMVVIERIYNSRLGKKKKAHALAPEAKDRDFHFWFSTTSAALDPNTDKHAYFQQVENRVKELEKDSKGKLHLHFNEKTSTVLDI